jgi:hypothetical protein
VGEGICEHILQLADLVATPAEAGQVISLDEDPGPTEVLGQAWAELEWCRQGRQRQPGNDVEHCAQASGHRAQTTSNNPAAPMPPPTHIVTIPYRPPVR